MDFSIFITPVLGCLLLLLQLICDIIQMLIPLKYKMKEIKGEIALVTGGAGGLGKSIAMELSKHGVIVVIWDINEEALTETVKLIKDAGGTCYGYVCNLMNREEIYAKAKQLKEEIGKVTILLNNAGISHPFRFQDISDNDLQNTMKVNIISHFWLAKAFLPGMIEMNKGHITSIASVAGCTGYPYLTDYSSSKHAIIGFYDSLNVELLTLGYNIKTTIICPFLIKGTNMNAEKYSRSRLLPVLNAEEVAKQTIIAMRCNKRKLTIPGYFSLLQLINCLFPWLYFQIAIYGQKLAVLPLTPDGDN